MNTLLSQPVEYFISHRQPMTFIDQILAMDKGYLKAQFTVKPTTLFIEKEGLPTWVSIEIMAQTIALYAGILIRKKGQQPHIGFLLGSRKIELKDSFFPIDSKIIITVKELLMGEDGLGQFDCHLSVNNISINAILSVYQS